ncbi:MAG: HlyD family secretion protein [Oligoflexia bacterium]|nr:HlyD family secretion protein [Oligoflexia bacterium]
MTTGLDWKKLRLAAFVLAGTLAGAWYAYDEWLYVSTDDAAVQARFTYLSSRVPGLVTKMNVDDDEKVKAGQILIEIEPRDYENSIHVQEAERDALTAKLRDAEKKYHQFDALYRSGAINQQQFDTAEATFHELRNKVMAAHSQVAQGQLDLEYTGVKAPTDGTVGKRNVEVGMFAGAGQPLIGFVQRERWIVANLKETQLGRVRLGDPVTVAVDSIDGRKFNGVVESIATSTGATFTLLPPDNATGNFIKIVQRVPVKIKLLQLSENDIDRLQVGLSAYVKINTR